MDPEIINHIKLIADNLSKRLSTYSETLGKSSIITGYILKCFKDFRKNNGFNNSSMSELRQNPKFITGLINYIKTEFIESLDGRYEKEMDQVFDEEIKALKNHYSQK